MSDPSEVQTFLCGFFENDAEVVQPQIGAARFGSRGFKVAGRVFAMESNGALALKLPVGRVSALTDQGKCVALSMGGRRMKEWVLVNDRAIWPILAQEAREFVRAI
jgi:hypothetical protein